MALYDLEITSSGRLRTFPQTAPSDIQMDLEIVGGKTPISLVVSLSDYKRLTKLFNHKKCLMSEEAREAIELALEAGKKVARPITKPTDFELMAYVEEVRTLKCIKDVDIPEEEELPAEEQGKTIPRQKFAGLKLTAGKEYEFNSKKIGYIEPFTKPKFTMDETTGEVSTRMHQMSFEGSDYALEFTDDREWKMRFRDHVTLQNEIDEGKIWEYFEKPVIPTQADDNQEKYDMAIDTLKYMEEASNPPFGFYPGQMNYIASASISESALIAAETGCGKTLISIAMVMLKAPARALICAPKGTVHSKDSKVHAQWVQEFARFAPEIPVHKLFSMGDYENLLNDNGGELPYGVFLTYDNAMFRTGMEHVPDSWSISKTIEIGGIKKKVSPDPEKLFRQNVKDKGYNVPALFDVAGIRDKTNYHFGLGQERTMDVEEKGRRTGNKVCVRCIANPCMATELGLETWDMVILDEAHHICNLDSQMTKNFIRLQPKYRFAVTATPIPNMIKNIFSLMGWLSVPYWYYGDRSNASWPFKLDELTGRSGFSYEFITKEVDHTQAKLNFKAGKGPAAKKDSPKISQQAKLLKLLRPKVAYMPKRLANPNMAKLNVIKMHVPMSREQRMNYHHYMDASNVKTQNKMMRYGIQLAYLRGITATPKSCGKSRKEGSYNIYSGTDYTPKTHAILSNIYNIISRDEQVLVAAARSDQLHEIKRRLDEAKIPVSLITGSNSDKAKDADDFKQGKTKVMLMGIKCAESLSFEQCSNMIIASLEWSYGVFDQAVGRCYRINSPKDVNCYVYLHEKSLEDMMFDKLCTKQDAATIALVGEKVDNEVITMDEKSVQVKHIMEWQQLKGTINLNETTEEELLKSWKPLLDKLMTITAGEEAGITKEDKNAVKELLDEMEDLLG